MKCKYCGCRMRLLYIDRLGHWVFLCDNCYRKAYTRDKQTIKLYKFREKLLETSNHSHNAFVFRLVREYGKISTIFLLRHCATAYISNGDREARTLKTKGLLGNYKPPGKKYVVWFEKSLVA